MKKIMVVGLVVVTMAAGATALHMSGLIGGEEGAPKVTRLSKDFGAYVLNV